MKKSESVFRRLAVVAACIVDSSGMWPHLVICWSALCHPSEMLDVRSVQLSCSQLPRASPSATNPGRSRYILIDRAIHGFRSRFSHATGPTEDPWLVVGSMRASVIGGWILLTAQSKLRRIIIILVIRYYSSRDGTGNVPFSFLAFHPQKPVRNGAGCLFQ